MIEAKIIADSRSESGVRLTTFQLVYPRFIHAEFMTHRVFSRNASSSRAIPVAKMIEQVRTNPAMPVHWGQNQPGMQANAEIQHVGAAKDQWVRAAKEAADIAEEMTKIGLHKQVANRILEPFQWIHVVVTATEWDNFFVLRAHKDAQPEIQELAVKMKKAMDDSTPRLLRMDEWHLPYVLPSEIAGVKEIISPNLRLSCMSELIKVSAARCARVSYLKHDGSAPNLMEDLALYDRLVGSEPIHASPIEHQARPMPVEHRDAFFGNFRGWMQYRKQFESAMA